MDDAPNALTADVGDHVPLAEARDPPGFELPMVRRCIKSSVRIDGCDRPQEVLILTTLLCSVETQLNEDQYGCNVYGDDNGDGNGDDGQSSGMRSSSSSSSSDFSSEEDEMNEKPSRESGASECGQPAVEVHRNRMKAFWLRRLIWENSRNRLFTTYIYLAKVLHKAAQCWEQTDELVAVKMVSWDALRSHGGLQSENFVQEVSALHALSTWRNKEMPDSEVHVMTPDVIMASESHLYFVTPYSRDGCLCMKVADEGPLAEDVAKFWFTQIVKGLETLQRAQICHRDLSPENVLISGNICRLIDLGMSLRIPYSALGRHFINPQRACGKRQHVAPEILQEQPLDGHAIDIWAVGTILLFMLTGRRLEGPPLYDRPFENADLSLSPNAMDLIRRIFRLNPVDRLNLQEIQRHPFLVT